MSAGARDPAAVKALWDRVRAGIAEFNEQRQRDIMAKAKVFHWDLPGVTPLPTNADLRAKRIELDNLRAQARIDAAILAFEQQRAADRRPEARTQIPLMDSLRAADPAAAKPCQVSDGSSADYYKLPPESTQLQDLISARDMNAQMGEIFRAVYRYGQVAHSPKLRDAKKILFYIQAEIARLEKLEEKR